MPFPILGAIGAAAGLLGAINSDKRAKEQKELSREALEPQRLIAEKQMGTYDVADPAYRDLLAAARSHAGFQTYQSPRAGAPGVLSTWIPGRGFVPVSQVGGKGTAPYSGVGVRDSELGIFDSPQDRLRFQQAEEDLRRLRNQQREQVTFELGQRGIGGATLAQALSAIDAEYMRGLANTRRQLAINAPLEQERRFGFLAGLTNTGLGQGGSAASLYGQQANISAANAAQFGNQAAQGFGQVGQALSDYEYLQALRRGRIPTPKDNGRKGFIVGGSSPWDYDPDATIDA